MEILIPSFFLSLFGLFNLFGLNQELFFKQFFYTIFAFLVYFLIKKLGRHFFKLNYSFFYHFFLFSLIITFIIGIEARGSKRWLDFYFFRFQSSEFLKPFFILYLSEIFSKKEIFYNNFSLFLKSFIYFFIPFIIIFKQPDLANSLIFLIVYGVLIYFSYIPKRYPLYFGLLGAFFLPFSWFFLKDYQKQRLLSFFNPHFDTQGTSYNMIQSVITVGSGQFFGKGLGRGTQSRLFFLPESNTDFAFASLVEQFGFFGGFFVIFFYFLIVLFLTKKVIHYFYDKNERDNFFYTLGVLVYFSFQVIVNIGMNLGVLPVAGVALPLISYGGSAIMSLMISFSLLP